MNFGRRKDEDHMWRRLFQRLEQSVEGRVREHMDFIDDIDAVRSSKRSKLHILADFTDVVHARIGGAVDLDDINRVALRDLLTISAGRARRSRWPLFTVERFRENSGDGGLADAARPGKQIGLRNPFRGDRVDQRLHDMRLTDHVVEGPRAVFSGGDLVIHLGLAGCSNGLLSKAAGHSDPEAYSCPVRREV